MQLSQLYQELKKCLQDAGYRVGKMEEIAYGMQFNIENHQSGLLRVYQNKKGRVKYDYSQLNGDIAEEIIALLERKRDKQRHDIGYPVIGSDEAGKGDYFGPLVCAAVYVDETAAAQLLGLGVRDSKTIHESKLYLLEDRIRTIVKNRYNIVELSPPAYNHKVDQYRKHAQKLNHLLADLHAGAIEPLLKKTSCHHVLVDRFADERLMNQALAEPGSAIHLVQLPAAEANIAVAAASVLAKACFVRRLSELSSKYGFSFSKGASAAVVAQARRFVRRHGREMLSRVAKTHFKTTRQI